jgi:hypothetical protein
MVKVYHVISKQFYVQVPLYVIREAKNAESKADLHKMDFEKKQMKTLYWLNLRRTNYIK